MSVLSRLHEHTATDGREVAQGPSSILRHPSKDLLDPVTFLACCCLHFETVNSDS